MLSNTEEWNVFPGSSRLINLTNQLKLVLDKVYAKPDLFSLQWSVITSAVDTNILGWIKLRNRKTLESPKSIGLEKNCVDFKFMQKKQGSVEDWSHETILHRKTKKKISQTIDVPLSLETRLPTNQMHSLQSYGIFTLWWIFNVFWIISCCGQLTKEEMQEYFHRSGSVEV